MIKKCLAHGLPITAHGAGAVGCDLCGIVVQLAALGLNPAAPHRRSTTTDAEACEIIDRALAKPAAQEPSGEDIGVTVEPPPLLSPAAVVQVAIAELPNEQRPRARVSNFDDLSFQIVVLCDGYSSGSYPVPYERKPPRAPYAEEAVAWMHKELRQQPAPATTVERPAVGSVHPFDVAEADAKAHGSRWDRKGAWTWTVRRGKFGWQHGRWPRDSGHAWEQGQLPATEMLTRLPDDQPTRIEAGRLDTPDDCNCDQARELRAEVTKRGVKIATDALEITGLRVSENNMLTRVEALHAELEKLGYIFRASDTLKRERDDLRAELVTLKINHDKWSARALHEQGANLELRAELERVTAERDALIARQNT